MKKKILSLILSLVMALGCAPVAGAQQTNGPEEILRSIPYYGDRSQCVMSAEMALTYADVIRSLDTAHSRALLFDAGNGIPMLWVAYGEKESRSRDGNSWYLEENYGRKMCYYHSVGTTVELSWPTTLLLTGQNGIIAYAETGVISDFSTEYAFYYLENGSYVNWPFAQGYFDVSQGFVLKGKAVPADTEADYYKIVHPKAKVLANASEGLADMEILQGDWMDGRLAADLLEQYAAELSTGLITQAYDDVLPNVSSQERNALFADLLYPFSGSNQDIDFRTASEQAIADVMLNVWYDLDRPYDFGFDRHLNYHDGFSKARLDQISSALFGRTITLAPFARTEEPSPEDQNLYCFSYQGALYFHGYFGRGDFMGEINAVPLHLYDLGGGYYYAMQKEYWYYDYGGESQRLCSMVVKNNGDAGWQVVRIYPHNYIPTLDELASFSGPSSWAKAEVEAATAAGLVPVLTGNPGYQEKITRQQFAELIVTLVEQATGSQLEAAPIGTFSDCSSLAVRKAAANGIVNGMGDGIFAPNKTTNREQIATMVNRAIDYIQIETGIDLTPKEGSINKFADKNQVSSWAVEGVGTLAANGIMNGTSSTTLSPKNTCTVEQSILLSFRTYEKLS